MADDKKPWYAELILAPASKLLLLAGIVVTCLALSGGVTYKDFWPVHELSARIVLGLFGVALIGASLWTDAPRSPGVPKATDYGVEILLPKPNEEVEEKVHVQGLVKKRPPKEYRLVVFRVYPLIGGVISEERPLIPLGPVVWTGDLRWELEAHIAGQPGDVRGLGVYLVGPDGMKFITYCMECMGIHAETVQSLREVSPSEKFRWLRPIPSKPSDILECAIVDVRRIA